MGETTMKYLNPLMILSASALSCALASSSQAIECMTPTSVPVLLIATTESALTLDGDSLPAQMDDSKLVCVKYNSNNHIEAIEYVKRSNAADNESVSFPSLIANGYNTTQNVPFIGNLLVNRTTCPDCRVDANEITMTMGLLNKYRLVGGSKWIYPKMTVSFASRAEPRVTFQATPNIPMQVMTLRSKAGMGGGVKQIRLSECVDSNLTACLKSTNPKLRHVKSFTY